MLFSFPFSGISSKTPALESLLTEETLCRIVVFTAAFPPHRHRPRRSDARPAPRDERRPSSNTAAPAPHRRQRTDRPEGHKRRHTPAPDGGPPQSWDRDRPSRYPYPAYPAGQKAPAEGFWHGCSGGRPPAGGGNSPRTVPPWWDHWNQTLAKCR